MAEIEMLLRSMIEQEVKGLREEVAMLRKELGIRNAGEYLSSREVGESYGISRTTLWRMHKAGDLKQYLIGEKALYRRSELEALIKVY